MCTCACGRSISRCALRPAVGAWCTCELGKSRWSAYEHAKAPTRSPATVTRASRWLMRYISVSVHMLRQCGCQSTPPRACQSRLDCNRTPIEQFLHTVVQNIWTNRCMRYTDSGEAQRWGRRGSVEFALQVLVGWGSSFLSV